MDGQDFPDGGEGGQDLCSFFSSFIDQRASVERLLSWLRESQTACTGSNCFDEINGLPGTEHGAPLTDSDELGYSQDSEPFSLVLFIVLGLLSIYAMNLNRNRQQNVPTEANKTGSLQGGLNGNNHRRNNDDDDHSMPGL